MYTHLYTQAHMLPIGFVNGSQNCMCHLSCSCIEKFNHQALIYNILKGSNSDVQGSCRVWCRSLFQAYTSNKFVSCFFFLLQEIMKTSQHFVRGSQPEVFAKVVIECIDKVQIPNLRAFSFLWRWIYFISCDCKLGSVALNLHTRGRLNCFVLAVPSNTGRL